MAGRPPIFETPELMDKAIEDYFNPIPTTETQTPKGKQKFKEARQPRDKVTISGLCYFLGFESRQSFYDYEERPEFSYIVKRARMRVEMSYEERLSESACTGAIFALKNMGWKDKSEQEVTMPQGLVVNYNKQAGNEPLND